METAPNLVLVGPMGAGKSAIGRRLAERLGLPFADLDDDIEAATGAAIPLIFDCEGEAGFRARERAALAERLALAGYTAVAYNASGSGVDDSGEFVWPERFGRNTFSAELADLGTQRRDRRHEPVDDLFGRGEGYKRIVRPMQYDRGHLDVVQVVEPVAGTAYLAQQ